jgi:DNA-binding CsgD family transcriptional regulator
MVALSAWKPRQQKPQAILPAIPRHPADLPDTPASAVRHTKSAGRRLRPDELDEVVARYQAGEYARSIASAFEVSPDTVFNHLRRRGVSRNRNTRRLTAREVREAAVQYEAGASFAALGRQYDVARHTVSNQLRGAGVETRQRAGRT